MDVEARLASNTAKRVVVVGPILIGIFFALRGTDGAVAAGIGVAVVVANFVLSGWIMSVAARISLPAYHAAALFGFFLRLGLLMATMLLVVQFVDLDRPAFGIAAVVAYLALITWQTVAVAYGRERELEWIE